MYKIKAKHNKTDKTVYLYYTSIRKAKLRNPYLRGFEIIGHSNQTTIK